MSDKDEKVLYEEKIGNVFDEIKKLSDNNLIEVYLYPNKPNTINKVDLDYIDRINKIEKIYNKKTERKELLKLLYFHPNLIDSINIDKDEYDKEYLPLILYKDCVRENYDRR